MQNELLLVKLRGNAVFPQTDGKLPVIPNLLVNFSVSFSLLATQSVHLGLIISG